jgi:hypothetical protein
MVSAEASGALSPMAAMAKPKNRRMGRELLAGFVLLGRQEVFMVFWVLFSGFCFLYSGFFPKRMVISHWKEREKADRPDGLALERLLLVLQQ